MKPRVYIETTIPSYLTARPSNDLLQAAHQELTRKWWNTQRGEFEAVIAQIVIKECSAGDPTAAADRLAAISSLPLLPTTEEAGQLANALIAGVPFPPRAASDALHIANAAVHAVPYLLTWNCTHLHNAVLRKRVEAICRAGGYNAPIICTPEELFVRGAIDDDASH